VMSVGRTIEESLLKAVRSLEVGAFHLYMKKFDDIDSDELMAYITEGTDDRIFAIAELIRRGADIGLICNLTQIDMLFLEKIKNIVDFEKTAAANIKDEKTLYQAKRMGFSDKAVAWLWGVKEIDVYNFRLKHGIIPVYKMIDSCASEFESYIPYF